MASVQPTKEQRIKSLEDGFANLETSLKDFIRKELKEQFQANRRVSGWQRPFHWAREWGLGACMTVMVAMSAITAGAIYFGITQVGAISEFRGRTDEHLKNIDSSISSIRTDVASLIRINQAGGLATQNRPLPPPSLSTLTNAHPKGKRPSWTPPNSSPR